MLKNWFNMQRDKRLQEEENAEIQNITKAFDVTVKKGEMYIFCEGRAVELLDKALTIKDVVEKIKQMQFASISFLTNKSNEKNT